MRRSFSFSCFSCKRLFCCICRWGGRMRSMPKTSVDTREARRKERNFETIFWEEKKTGKTEKIIFFSLQCITVFSTAKKSIRLTGKLIFDCYFQTEYFNSVRFLNCNTIMINKQIILPIVFCNTIRSIVNNYFSTDLVKPVTLTASKSRWITY